VSVYRSSNSAAQGVHIAFVGCGSHKFAKSLAEAEGIPVNTSSSPSTIHFFVGSPEVYERLGMQRKMIGAPISRICKATARALWQGLTRCWCICQSGDVSQQGGEFVMAPNNQMLFGHMETRPGDHPDTAEFFGAAGVRL